MRLPTTKFKISQQVFVAMEDRAGIMNQVYGPYWVEEIQYNARIFKDIPSVVKETYVLLSQYNFLTIDSKYVFKSKLAAIKFTKKGMKEKNKDYATV